MEFWLTRKTAPPCHQEKQELLGGMRNKIISSAKNRISVVELEHLWEFVSINVKKKNNKGEENFALISVGMKAPEE